MNNKLNEMHKLFKEIGSLNYKLMYSKLEKIGFYPGQPIIIEIIYANPGISQRCLAKLAHKEPATITTMLNRMDNLIDKVLDENDKRITKLYLTEKGLDSFNKLNDVTLESRKIMFKDFTDDEINQIYSMLAKIKYNIENKEI